MQTRQQLQDPSSSEGGHFVAGDEASVYVEGRIMQAAHPGTSSDSEAPCSFEEAAEGVVFTGRLLPGDWDHVGLGRSCGIAAKKAGFVNVDYEYFKAVWT
ncbi:hypothetical protein RUND412_003395 [Rhizina undulata]